MLYSKDKQEKLFLGIDGGGSKCKAIIMTADNQILGSGISGPGNPLHGFEQAKDSIVKAAYLALIDAGLAETPLTELIAGVGLAGVNLPQQFEQMSAWQHPFKTMFLATDLLIACLGAHQGQDGAVMITGTGSCGFSYVRGQEFIIGAHGFPHGDKGSGGWFGLQAVEQVLLSLDGFKPVSILSKSLMDKLDCHTSTDIVEAVAGKPAAFYAGLANLVFDAAEVGDALALAIVHEGGAYISKVARALWQKNPPAMSIIGGLSSRLMPWLDQEVRERLITPKSPPEVGSVLFARQQLALLSQRSQQSISVNQ
ncbi:BadF/BadG/BcrA/BcrD ATPase family protein [Thalassomonas sp. RHCl1]|uniref:N-acetylglucosamine kinase n=1 Tax=Thalassomonas sp. RHCl1 TaxID=2995320 RepID=UPI00248CC43B|nr:BadF/BadG/BcrA/BcrD ATPase family protein [Thalassomonas sp. RHCl1]